eukprot:m.70847 g.70847  ORF g.70847 m.70847 type:complete len:116 (-) comp12271_c0_seq2:2095-2442(-)
MLAANKPFSLCQGRTAVAFVFVLRIVCCVRVPRGRPHGTHLPNQLELPTVGFKKATNSRQRNSSTRFSFKQEAACMRGLSQRRHGSLHLRSSPLQLAQLANVGVLHLRSTQMDLS